MICTSMKILLNMLSHELGGFWGFVERYQVRPALGLLLLTSVLRDAGHETDLADQRVARFDLQGWLRLIRAGGYGVVGLSTYSTTRPHHAAYITALRRQFAGTIIVGGPGVIESTVDFWLASGADMAVIGEGERTIVEVADALAAGRPLAGIAGTVVRVPGRAPVWGPPRPDLTVEEIEALPYPAWAPSWIADYTDSLIINARLPTAGVLTTRGCPYRCAFCSSPSLWRGIRQRSVASVLREIDWLVDTFGVRHIGFLDDIFGLTPRWTLEFCHELRRRPYELGWMICLHPLSFGKQRRAVYRAMADAGLNCISFGAQSANPQVLRNINRDPAEIAALREAVALCHELGISSSLTYIFGLPGDTPATVEQAIDFVLEVKPTVADFHPLYFFEGTELARRFPDCDANPFGYEEHKRWSRMARRRFYLNPRTVVRFAAYVLRHNPGYVPRLARIVLDAFPRYVFESGEATRWESGDRRTA